MDFQPSTISDSGEVHSTTWLPGHWKVSTHVSRVSSGGWWIQPSRPRGSDGTWCRAMFEKCLQVGGGWSVFRFIAKHLCFKSDPGSSRKLVERTLQWLGLGELVEIENKPCICILDQMQGWMAHGGRPSRSELQQSNPEMKRDWTSNWAASLSEGVIHRFSREITGSWHGVIYNISVLSVII